MPNMRSMIKCISEHPYLIIFILSCLLGFGIVTFFKGHESFNQNRFSAVVIKACTGKLQVVDPTQEYTAEVQALTEGLKSFTSRKSQSFPCELVTNNIDLIPRVPNIYSVDINHAYAHIYMVSSIALLWQIFGVDWSVVTILYALLFGLSMLSATLLFRLVVPLKWAVVMALILHLHPDFVNNYLRLRDFSKIPFIFFTLWTLAQLIKGVETPKHFWGLVVATALAIGVGSGFRFDVLVMLPLSLLVLLFLVSVSWRQRLLSIMIFLTVFSVGYYPLFVHAPEKSNMAHALLLGHMDHFNKSLDIQPASYSIGFQYVDSHVCMNIKQKAAINGEDLKACYGTEYSIVAGELYNDYMLMTPGNMLSRSVASFTQILKRDYPRIRTFINGYFTAIVFIIACTLLAGFHLRGGLFMFFSIVYLGGITSILYDLRHINHLNLYHVLSVGYCLFLIHRLYKGKQKYSWNTNNTIMVTVIAASFTLMSLGIAAGRYIQADNFERYNIILAGASRHEVVTDIERISPDIDRITPVGIFDGQENKYFKLAYLAFVFDPAKCDSKQIDLTSLYPSKTRRYDISMIHKLRFDPDDVVSSFYTPVFIDNSKSQFNSFSLSHESRKCLVKIEQLEDISKLKVLLHYWLSDAPDRSDYAQKINSFEHSNKLRYEIVRTRAPNMEITIK